MLSTCKVLGSIPRTTKKKVTITGKPSKENKEFP
jgi:hypothetical protein